MVIHTMMMNKKTMMGAFALMLACAFMIAAIPATESEASADTPATPSPTYTVTYIVGGDVFTKTTTPAANDTVIPLATLADLGASAAPGKTFSGWYVGNTLQGATVLMDDFDQVGETTNYVYQVEAKFAISTYTVTFIASGMNDVVKVYTHGAAVAIPGAYVAADGETPAVNGYKTPAGYALAGWSNGTSTFQTVPTVSKNVTYVAVFEKIVPTHTVTFMKDGAEYSKQTVTDVANAIAPYIEGYTWEAMIVGADGNAVVNAKAIPKAADNSLGIDNFTLAVIVIVLIAVIGIVLYVAYEQGFLPVGKNKIAGDAKR